jgi:hypothetical protein
VRLGSRAAPAFEAYLHKETEMEVRKFAALRYAWQGEDISRDLLHPRGLADGHEHLH